MKSRALPGLAIALALGTLLVPVILVRLPPVVDYHGHWVRLWLIAGGMDQPPLDTMYALDWSAAWTNIGIDLVAWLLGPITGGEVLGPVLLGLALVLPPLGAVLLNRSLFGGFHWWQAGFAIFAWTATFALGFVNFRVGIGLALLAAVAESWIARRPRVAATALRAGVTILLIVVHIFGAFFYAVLLAGLAFGAQGRQEGPEPSWPARLLRAGAATLIVGAATLMFLLVAPSSPIHVVEDGAYTPDYSVLNKALTLLSGVLAYGVPLEMVFLFAFWIAIHAAPVLLRAERHWQAHAGLLLAGGSLLVLAIAVPSHLAGTALIDIRFPAMAMLVLPAAVRPDFASRRAAMAVGTALLAIGIARTAWATVIWMAREADARSVERALAAVRPGDAVLPVAHPLPRQPPIGRASFGVATSTHLPAQGIRWRRAFSPILFAVRGRQPIRVLPPWDEIAGSEAIPGAIRFLDTPPETAFDRYRAGYMRCWRRRFDWLLVMNADTDDAGEALPGDLELVTDEGFARLYRIRRGETGPPC